MKNKFFFLVIAFILSCCSKDDIHKTLPPATQTGAGTFACLINGKPFIDDSGGFFNCYYQQIDGAYYFGIGGSDIVDMVVGESITTDQLLLEVGKTYQLTDPMQINNASGTLTIVKDISTGTNANTNEIYSGELTFTKLDFSSNIVSGIFWYNILNPYTNEIIEIREGRFDTFFTQ